MPDRFRSGLKSLDHALYEGGVPAGRMMALYGPPDVGKTALALWYCRTCLVEDERACGWISTEAPLSETQLCWAGLNQSDRFVLVPQSPATPGLKTAGELIRGGCDLVVIDSAAALLGELPEQSLVALLNTELSALLDTAERWHALVLFTNQVRQGKGGHESPAGQSPAWTRLVECLVELKATETLRRLGEDAGQRIQFSVVRAGANIEDWGRTGAYNLFWEGGLADLRGA